GRARRGARRDQSRERRGGEAGAGACGPRCRDRGIDLVLPARVRCRTLPPPRDERAGYEELASLLAELGVDLLVLEMMEDETHARRACDAVRAVGLPFWLGVSARRRTDGAVVAYDFPDTPLDAVLDALLGYAPAVVNVMHTPLDDTGAALAAVRAR